MTDPLFESRFEKIFEFVKSGYSDILPLLPEVLQQSLEFQ